MPYEIYVGLSEEISIEFLQEFEPAKPNTMTSGICTKNKHAAFHYILEEVFDDCDPSTLFTPFRNLFMAGMTTPDDPRRE